jgi:hypothetical protein
LEKEIAVLRDYDPANDRLGGQSRRTNTPDEFVGLTVATLEQLIFLTDIRPPGSPAEIASPVTSKAQTGA